MLRIQAVIMMRIQGSLNVADPGSYKMLRIQGIGILTPIPLIVDITFLLIYRSLLGRRR